MKTLEEWEKQLLSTAENIGKITVSVCEGFKKFVSSETFKQLIDFLSNIPDDIQETELFQSILELRKSKITYDTIDWFQNSYKEYLEKHLYTMFSRTFGCGCFFLILANSTKLCYTYDSLSWVTNSHKWRQVGK